MAEVLFLYTTDERENAEQLKRFLQVKMGNAINFISATDVFAEDRDIESVLENCACVVLVCSKQANEFIKNRRQEVEDGYVTFDGLLLSTTLEGREMLKKLLVVYFQKGVSQWKPDAVNTNSIYMIQEKFGSQDAIIDHLSDLIRAIITPCTTA